jgi:hypothetical protein
MMAAGAGDGVGPLLEEASRRWAALPAWEASELADTLLDALGTVLHDRHDAYYVSTPITTGPDFVAWWRRRGRGLDQQDPAYQAELSQVVRRNIEAVRPLVELVEHTFHHPVIDPTRLGPIPAWEQPDYHRFWVAVIRRFGQAVVQAEGWHYSSGCALEFAAAVTAGQPVLDASLQPVDPAAGVRLLEQAADELDAADLGSEYQRRALEEIRHAGHSREAS